MAAFGEFSGVRVPLFEEKVPSSVDLNRPKGTFPSGYGVYTHDAPVSFSESSFKSGNGGGGIANGFLATILCAYNNHLGLDLDPNDFLGALMNIVSQCINLDPERFREILVDFEGKRELVVETPSASNDLWGYVIDKWTEMTVPNDLTAIGVADFSTSTAVHRTCANARYLDCVKEFYDFTRYTKCGIPFVRLYGTADDWSSLKTKVEAVSTMMRPIAPMLSEYIDLHLVPVCTNLVRTFVEGPIEDLKTWWGHIISHTQRNGSGLACTWKGWAVAWFPRVRAPTAAKSYCAARDMNIDFNDALASVHPGVTDIPIKHVMPRETRYYKLHAGFYGTFQHEGGSLQVIHGYRLIEDPEKPSETNNSNQSCEILDTAGYDSEGTSHMEID